MAGILDGIRILDLTQYFLGPHATLLLSGLGADVIRVDNPSTGDALSGAPIFYGKDGPSLEKKRPEDVGVSFLKRLRGKKAITLNLKSDEGRELLFRLIETADVLVENFSVGVTDRLGIGYAAVHARNPKLVYASLTGYGQTGPDRHLRCYDTAAQAASGLMSLTGQPDGPPTKAGSALADSITSVFAFSGILAALFHAQRTGEGQQVDVAMVDSLFSLIYDDPLECYGELGFPMRQGNRIPRISPFNAYRTADGWMVIGAVSEAQWVGLCKAIGREDCLGKPEFKTLPDRLRNNDAVDALVTEWTSTRTTEEAVATLQEASVVCSAIRDIHDLKVSPQMQARDMIVGLEHPSLGMLDGIHAAGFPIKFSGTDSGYAGPAALPGTHNEEIYTDLLGLTEAELDRLKKDGII